MNTNKIKHPQEQHYRHKDKSSIKALCFTLMIAVIFLYTSEAMAADTISMVLSKNKWLDFRV